MNFPYPRHLHEIPGTEAETERLRTAFFQACAKQGQRAKEATEAARHDPLQRSAWR